MALAATAGIGEEPKDPHSLSEKGGGRILGCKGDSTTKPKSTQRLPQLFKYSDFFLFVLRELPQVLYSTLVRRKKKKEEKRKIEMSDLSNSPSES